MSKKKQNNNPDNEPEKVKNPVEDSSESQQVAPINDENAENTLLAELNSEKEKYLRLYAEYDNFRKRSQKERDAIYSDVRSDTILKILPVYDNLSRALSTECSDPAFYKGVEMTMAQLKSIFDKLGIIEIEALGKKFDPAVHNAVMHIDDDNYGSNEIIEEFEKGFKLGDKIIRFSMVKVAN